MIIGDRAAVAKRPGQFPTPAFQTDGHPSQGEFCSLAFRSAKGKTMSTNLVSSIVPIAMTGYRVTFFKRLLSSDGHPFNCLQHTIEIRRAKNAERAIKAAERRYERLCHVPDWRLHADTFESEACSNANV